MIVDPEDGSRLRYQLTGRAVSVRLDSGDLVDHFSLPDDVADDEVTLWLLAHHHDLMSMEEGSW